MSAFAISPSFVLTGLAGGLAIGLTGMGGGAVLTPVLLALGVPASTAIGSDLLASLFIKPVAGAVHSSAKTVRWDLVRWLSLGSVPTALLGSVLASRITRHGEGALKQAIGATILVAVAAMLLRAHRGYRANTNKPADALGTHHTLKSEPFPPTTGTARSSSTSNPVLLGGKARPLLTVALGALGGFLVGLTSVGSGSLMVVLLTFLYPKLSPKALVGTDIVQAVPLVAAAALGHVLTGNFRLGLTAALLIGGIPGALIGARLSSGRATRAVRPVLMTLLLATGVKLVAGSLAHPNQLTRPTQHNQFVRAPTFTPRQPDPRLIPRLIPSLLPSLQGLFMTTASELDLVSLNARFENAPAEDVVAWAHETFGDKLVTLCAMTSDTALVDLLSRRAPGASVVFLETGHHFAETHEQVAAVHTRYEDKVNFSTATSGLAPGTLWQTDPNACCNARKVEPMEAALAGNTAWITGVRRADSEVRAATPIVEIDRRGMVKINPIATWTDDDLETYLQLHEVPRHPLLANGYPSIGCEPCTRRVELGEDIRAGRWAGKGKTECGLHL